jgi:ribosomal-protein-alanine N-acetyltransferase
MASEQEIYSHLMKCNKNYTPSLDKRVNIQEYSSKIFSKAVTFEAWSEETLVGLVAAYFNNYDDRIGYITSVSTDKFYMGKGIATTLIKLCIDYARQHSFRTIFLEVIKANDEAIIFYKKLKFKEAEDKQISIIMKLDV